MLMSSLELFFFVYGNLDEHSTCELFGLVFTLSFLQLPGKQTNSLETACGILLFLPILGVLLLLLLPALPAKPRDAL